MHTLTVMPKLTPDAATQSGKCSCGQKRYNGASEEEIALQHEAHLAEVEGDGPGTPLDELDVDDRVAEGDPQAEVED